MSELISQREYARRRRERGLPGGTLRAVQKAIEAERIRLIDGKIDPEVADIQWDRNTDPDQQKRGAGGNLGTSLAEGREPAPTLQASAQPAVGDQRPSQSGDQVSRIREAARADAARAELLEYQLQEKQGKLVRAEDVRRAAMEKARVARDALLGIPNRLAPILAAESDPAKVHGRLAEELRRVCAELAAGEEQPTRQ